MPKRAATPVDMKEVRAVRDGEQVRLGGDWRSVTRVEPHDLDAYLTIYTADGRAWTRNIFARVAVRSG